MFGQFLFVNWKATRFGLIPFLMAAFGLPLLTVQRVRFLTSLQETSTRMEAELIHAVSTWSHLYPALAFALGTVFALMVWNGDHRGGHVYPLSLPLPRWKYVLYKMGAGALILLVPVFIFWVGCLLAVSVAEIPDGMRGYPTAITFRFLLTTVLFFSVFFAMAAGTMRTAIALLVAWILLLFLGETLPPLIGGQLGIPALEDFRFLRWFLPAAQRWPGPFEVLAGNWMLIDV